MARLEETATAKDAWDRQVCLRHVLYFTFGRKALYDNSLLESGNVFPNLLLTVSLIVWRMSNIYRPMCPIFVH